MTAATIRNINAAIAKHGVEVVKGNGYFYFADTGEAYLAEHIASVYSCQLRALSLEEWVSHVEAQVQNAIAA